MNPILESQTSSRFLRLADALRAPLRGLAAFFLLASLLAACTQDAAEAPDGTTDDAAAVVEGEDAEGATGADAMDGGAVDEENENEGSEPADDAAAEGSMDEAPPVVDAVITLEPGGDAAGAEGEEGKPGPNEVVPVPAEPHPLLGQAAPGFTMIDAMTDEPVDLADYAGQTVLLNYWATWCVPCRQEMPWIQSTYEKYKDQGFAVLAIDTAEQIPPEQIPGRVKQYAERTGLSFPMLLDEGNAVGADYGVTSALPISFFVNGEGVITHHHQGMYPNEVSLEQLIRQQMGLDEAETASEG